MGNALLQTDAGVEAPKLNKYGRDPSSPSEQLRRSGWFAFPVRFLADLPRLCAGKVEWNLIAYAWSLDPRSRGAGSGRKINESAPPEWGEPTTVRRLAAHFNCTERAVLDAIANTTGGTQSEPRPARKLMAVRKAGPGQIQFKVLDDAWEALPDYQPPGRVIPISAPKPQVRRIRRLSKEQIGMESGEGFELRFEEELHLQGMRGHNKNGSKVVLDVRVEPDGFLAVDIPGHESADTEERRTEGDDRTTLHSFTNPSPCFTEDSAEKAKDKEKAKPPKLAHKPVPPKPSPAVLTPDETQVRDAVRAYGLFTDASAIGLVQRCREKQPDVTADQICELVHEIGAPAKARDTVHNPVGVILRQLPDYLPISDGVRKPPLSAREAREQAAIEMSRERLARRGIKA